MCANRASAAFANAKTFSLIPDAEVILIVILYIDLVICIYMDRTAGSYAINVSNYS